MLIVLEASNNRPTLISLNNINKQPPPPVGGLKDLIITDECLFWLM